MTLVFASQLGQLVQTQFGVNEIAACVVVGKAVGSLLTRKSDAAVFQPLANEYSLFVRAIPKYLEPVVLARPGTIYGGDQRKFRAANVLEDVDLNSVEGIATFLTLVLRHVETVTDLVDQLEDLLKGQIWIVGRASTGSPADSEFLPFSLRNVLRSFVTAVVDADADSPQQNNFRDLVTKLVSVIGSSEFLEKSSDPSQHEQDRFIADFLGKPKKPRIGTDGPSHFDTLSARAAMVALACAANGADILVRCMIGASEPFAISEPPNASRSREHIFVFTLWLAPPPEEVYHSLNMWATQEIFETRSNATGQLPIFGGVSEICKIVSRQCNVDFDEEVQVALWKGAERYGHASASWEVRFPSTEPDANTNPALLYRIRASKLVEDIVMPSSLAQKADEHFQVPRKDPRHNLSRIAASILHETLKYHQYEDFSSQRFTNVMNYIIIALVTGWIGSLASPSSRDLYGYAWTADRDRLCQYAQILVDRGLTLNQILPIAACIWGGMSPSFTPYIPSNASLVGVKCPQITIILNVLFQPKEVARSGFQGGLFTLLRGSTPMIPRDQFSGFIYAGEKPFRKVIQDVDAMQQIPMESDSCQDVIFTMEPQNDDSGRLSLIICGWLNGRPAFEMDPLVVLAGLVRERNLEYLTSARGSSRNRTVISHMSIRELVTYTAGFKVRNGNVLVRVGSRPDMQVVAAGCHLGRRTVMVREESDAALLRNAQALKFREADSGGSYLEVDLPCTLRQGGMDGGVFIFCSDNFPSDLGLLTRT